MSKIFGKKTGSSEENTDIENNIEGLRETSESENDDVVKADERHSESGSDDKAESESDIESENALEDDGDAVNPDDDEETPDIEKKKKKRKSKKKKKETNKDINIVKELLSLIIYIGAIVLLCYFIITFVGCRARVDGNSMNPTLQNNDSLWVDKISYKIGDPKRFDVIIFDYDENTDYVKRIIGLPGEKVRIDQDGNIYINDEILEENYGNERIRSTNIGRASQTIMLGEDEYFVLGDNRNNSSDSRYADVGNVKREDIVGKVRLRIYPFSSIGFIR
jgi:signal peptidase I